MEEAERTEETESKEPLTEREEADRSAAEAELNTAEKETEKLSEAVAETEEEDFSEEEAELELDAHMSTGVLYDYLLHHVYTSLAGPLGTCLGLAAVAYFAYSKEILYLIMGLLLIFYLPLTLWRRAATLMLATPAFKEKLHYRFSESGFTVSQGGERNCIRWDLCTKAVSTGKSILIYTGPKNASIFPRKQIEGGAELLIAVIARHMEPKRIKIRY